MIHRTNVKLNHLVLLWTNGASAQAREKLQNLRKKELAALLVLPHQLDAWFALPQSKQDDFRIWVVRTLGETL